MRGNSKESYLVFNFCTETLLRFLSIKQEQLWSWHETQTLVVHRKKAVQDHCSASQIAYMSCTRNCHGSSLKSHKPILISVTDIFMTADLVPSWHLFLPLSVYWVKRVWSVVDHLYSLVLKIRCGNSHCVYDCLRSIAAVLQDDCMLLKRPDLTPSHRIAVQLRMTEKKILAAAEDYVKQQMKAWRCKQIVGNKSCMWSNHRLCEQL